MNQSKSHFNRINRKIYVIFLLSGLVLLGFQNALAEEKAHVHGESEWSIAVEGHLARLQADIPADSILGFEHEAKKAKHVDQKNRALQSFEKNISEMVHFSQFEGCHWDKKKLEQVFDNSEKTHSDIEVEFNFVCEKSIIGSKIVFNIQKFFPKLKKVRVQLLYNDVQKSLLVTQNGDSLELN